MPAANVFAPVIETGASATVGPARGNLGFSFGGAGDNHVAAGLLVAGLVLLILLHKSYKFSAKVSG